MPNLNNYVDSNLVEENIYEIVNDKGEIPILINTTSQTNRVYATARTLEPYHDYDHFNPPENSKK